MNNADSRPPVRAQYVALGSSFAAGIGLGPRAPGSPRACRRTINGYPQQLARLCGLSLVDRTSSGATTGHVLNGGQFGQGPQLDGLSPETELVTLTAGGNDVQYVGDLILLAYRARSRLARVLMRPFWKGARPAGERDFESLHRNLRAIVDEAHRRAPQARILLVGYPQIVPSTGTCTEMSFGEDEALLMREVGRRLDAVTRDAARDSGAHFVDMAPLSAAHVVGSAQPWVTGAPRRGEVPFHPTLEGAKATALQVASTIGRTPPNADATTAVAASTRTITAPEGRSSSADGASPNA